MQKWLAASSIVVVIPELVEDKWYEYSLHNQRELLHGHSCGSIFNLRCSITLRHSLQRSLPLLFLVFECLHWIMKGSPLPGLDPKKCLKSA